MSDQILKAKTFRFPKDLLKKLQYASTDLELSEQEIARRALEAYLQAIEKQKSK